MIGGGGLLGNGDMARTVLAWVSGYGRVMIPLAPYRLEQIPGDPRSLLVKHSGVWGTRAVLVTLPPEGGEVIRRVGLTMVTRGVVDVFPHAQRPDLVIGSSEADWRIECELFSVRWPEAFALESSDAFPPPFDLVGPGDSRLWVQGPLRDSERPTLEELATPDQQVISTSTLAGKVVVELGYELDGELWRMFHVVVERGDGWTFFVSGQGLAADRDELWLALRDVVSDMRFPPVKESLPDMGRDA